MGKTENPQFRLKSHFNSYGSHGLKYPPIKVIKIIPNCSNFMKINIQKSRWL